MQTLVLYARAGSSRGTAPADGLERVESHFTTLWPPGWTRNGLELSDRGLYLWDDDDAGCRWPSWSDDGDAGVATLYVPLGYQSIVGDVAPERSPQSLARALIDTPEAVFDLTPPLVLARAGRRDQRLDLWTDALGVGRMFQLRTSRGWVWSNRAEAACLFAGTNVSPDPIGWRYHAAIDWFMGETSPIEGVTAVSPATHVTVCASGSLPVISRLDPSTVFRAGPVDFEEVAYSLRAAARSVHAIWPGVPTLDLTGGRDSRVVAAAFLAEDVDVRLHTHDAVQGEAEVAEHLVGLLDRPVVHDTVRSSATARGARPMVAVEQVMRWHRFSGGLRPPSYLTHAPQSLRNLEKPVIGGAGGEVAHGFYYPARIATMEALRVTERLPAFRDHLVSRLVPQVGPTQAARAEAAAQIDRVLRVGLSLGLSDAVLLDYFYADERLRRWGMIGERRGLISPLLTPAFVRAAFALGTQDRLSSELHRGVLRHLVPQWADVPFFKAGRGSSPPMGRRAPPAPPEPFRLGLALDADRLDEVFTLASRWSADLDPVAVRGLWAASRAGSTTAGQELVLWRVVWQDVFHDYLAETLRGAAAPRLAPAPEVPAAHPPGRVKTWLIPLARTRPGRALRHSRIGSRLAGRLR